MTWIAYEEGRIIHVPSRNRIIMESHKIAWNNRPPQECIIIRDGDSVYDSENEDDFRKLKESDWNFATVRNGLSGEMLSKRYVVKPGHEKTRYKCRHAGEQFDNVTDYYVIRCELWPLFVSTDAQAFEKAKQALQFGLRAIRLDELKGMPSDCNPTVFRLINEVVEWG